MRFNRIFGLILVFILAASFAFAEEQAEDLRVKESCGLTIRNYGEGVSKGTLRFVSQKTATAADYGWGRYAKDKNDLHAPAHNCSSAVQSMAFSYIGIDAAPEAIVAQMTNFATNYGFEEADTAYRTGNYANAKGLDRFLERYNKDGGAGVASPVIVHFQNGGKGSKLHQHCVLVIGKDEDGRYIAVDPAQDWDNCIKSFKVKTNKNGRSYVSGTVARGNEKVYIDAVEQYYLIDPGLAFFD